MPDDALLRRELHFHAEGHFRGLEHDGQEGLFARRHHVKGIAHAEPVALAQREPAAAAFLHHAGDLVLADVAAVGKHLSRHPAEVKAGGILPVAHLPQFVRDGAVRHVTGRGRRVIAVDRLPVGVGHRRRVIRGFGAPLDFEGGNAARDQARYIVDHAHIAGIENVRPVILKDLEFLPLALFLGEVIFPPAGLRAVAPVGVASGHIA